MAEHTLPGAGLSGGYALYDTGWNIGVNQNWLKISAFLQCRVLSKISPLPDSPTQGMMFIVPSGTNANKIVLRDESAWVYLTPGPGCIAWVQDEGLFVIFDGVNWISLFDHLITDREIGKIAWFAMSNPPDNWIEANGATLARSQYSGLFAAIGTTFGAGNGSTTFVIPDLRGVFVRGWDHGRSIDTGRGFGTYQDDDLKSHSHQVYIRASEGGNVPRDGGTGGSPGSSTTATGGAETRPKNVALLPCIKYQ